MKGVIAEKQGAPWTLTESLEVPEPAADQILVKSIFTAINPIDRMMADLAVLVESWPLVPGVDAGGIVVKVGEKAASRFKVGDEVCGCTRLGMIGYSTCNEYFLMDAEVTIPKPKNLSLLEATTIGVGTETAALAVFLGLDIPVLDPKNLPAPKDEWVIVLGGASSVGKFAIQFLKLSGYKVIASCSAKSVELVKQQGADSTFNYYGKSNEEQAKEVLEATGGKIYGVVDAAATGHDLAKILFTELPEKGKYFATTNSWSNIPDFAGGRTYWIVLGEIGRPNHPKFNKLSGYIPIIKELFEDGKLIPNNYELIGSGGFEDVLKALDHQNKGTGGNNKVVVKIQDP